MFLNNLWDKNLRLKGNYKLQPRNSIWIENYALLADGAENNLKIIYNRSLG